MTRERVMVGLSGGVDSAVAALLLRDQGYSVECLFMKNWEEDDDAEHCSAAQDLADARAVAEHLGLKLHLANFAADYWDRVFVKFLEAYRAGYTPNPDVLCNREIKFDVFLEHAARLGADSIATGHYARIECGAEGARRLLRCADPDKDQTYFLYMLNQHQLSRAHFPLADLTKSQVRTIARDAGLPNHGRRDSTGVCFIGERPFRAFLEQYLPTQPGEILTLDGRVVGRHSGLMFYTPGQRKGLGIGGQKGLPEGSWYVVDRDVESNRLVVDQDANHPLLMGRALRASVLHWVAGEPPATRFACHMRLRHRQALQDCEVWLDDEAGCRVEFGCPQRAVAAGQSVVFYRDEVCLGGGIIQEVERVA